MKHASLWDILSKTLVRVAHLRQRNALFREGRRYTVWHVLRIFLLCLGQDFSPGVFYEKLLKEKGFRKRFKLPNRLISLSQFKKRLHSPCFKRALEDLLGVCAQDALGRQGKQEVRIVAMDLTRIPSDPRRDPYGAWGFDSRGLFYGYKVGLIISQEGILLGLTLLKGNWTEFRAQRSLLRKARTVIQRTWGELPVQYVVADSGFDGEPTYREARRQLKAPLVCPPRRRRNPKASTARQVRRNARHRSPQRFRDQTLWDRPEIRALYRKRDQIERVNGQLKDTPFRLAELPRRTRGLKHLLRICLGKAVVYNAALNVNALRGVSLRRIKALAS